MKIQTWLQEEFRNKKELERILKRHVLNNQDSRLSKEIPTLLKMVEQNKFKALLQPDLETHTHAYRFIDIQSVDLLKTILPNKQVKQDEKYHVLGKGVLKPKDQLSSWTVNPRSFVYSGFFARMPKHTTCLVLFKAKTKPNDFFGNPDSMASELETEPGYWLERELIGVGNITYVSAVYGFKKPEQSLEGLALDLINKVWNIKLVDFDAEEYYFPTELRPKQ